MSTKFEVITGGVYPSSPVVGQCVYNVDSGLAEWWNGKDWISNIGAKIVESDATIPVIYDTTSSYYHPVCQVNNRIFVMSNYPKNGSPDYMSISIYDYDPVEKTVTLFQQGLGADMYYRNKSAYAGAYNSNFSVSSDGLTLLVGAYGEKDPLRNISYEGKVWTFTAPDLTTPYVERQKIGINEDDLLASGNTLSSPYFGKYCGFCNLNSDKYIYMYCYKRYWSDNSVSIGYEIHKKNETTGDYELYYRINPEENAGGGKIGDRSFPVMTDDLQNVVVMSLDTSTTKFLYNYVNSGTTLVPGETLPLPTGTMTFTNSSFNMFIDSDEAVYIALFNRISNIIICRATRDVDGQYRLIDYAENNNTQTSLKSTAIVLNQAKINMSFDSVDKKLLFGTEYFDILGENKGNIVYKFLDFNKIIWNTVHGIPDSAVDEEIGLLTRSDGSISMSKTSLTTSGEYFYMSYDKNKLLVAYKIDGQVNSQNGYIIKDLK